MKEPNYIQLLADIKQKIQDAQVKAVVAANSQMLLLYWQLGNMIIINQQKEGWGSKIIETLATDLRKEFPEIKGFSVRNLLYMKQFAYTYSLPVLHTFIRIENELKNTTSISQQFVAKLLLIDNEQFIITQPPVAQLQNTEISITQPPVAQLENAETAITQQPAAQLENAETVITQQAAAQLEDNTFLASIIAKISWSHHMTLLDKETHLGKRLWYMLNTLEHGSSRNILAMQIESGLFERQIASKKVNNFERTLPKAQTDLANFLLKDPYIFDFVQAKESADERNIEEQLTNHITKFLLELGQGFAFVGRQVHFEVGDSDFYADLLFYHTQLHAYVVVELKARPFEPGDASQLNFYVNVVNDKMKTATDNDTIGILLCKGKNEVVAEYALKGYSNAIGISDYQISKAIPDELKSLLPKIDDLENELRN